MSQSIDCLQANLARLSVETLSFYNTLLRETIELKLYYLRDTHSPFEFDQLVDEELKRALAISETQTNFKDIVKSIKKIFKIFK
jgi:hypothetical protein